MNLNCVPPFLAPSRARASQGRAFRTLRTVPFQLVCVLFRFFCLSSLVFGGCWLVLVPHYKALLLYGKEFISRHRFACVRAKKSPRLDPTKCRETSGCVCLCLFLASLLRSFVTYTISHHTSSSPTTSHCQHRAIKRGCCCCCRC